MAVQSFARRVRFGPTAAESRGANGFSNTCPRRVTCELSHCVPHTLAIYGE